ncbi:hypothetical protein AaE_004084 [Aphanomyces astaci]|uniref:Uncharacterized protein n=1 Tax=Aphanomyces astaci TaxID=112090 RepID=A0A6A5A5P1_APHAT|nr:hypothetical protein AaE_004084 [Aphanomyces astaci]
MAMPFRVLASKCTMCIKSFHLLSTQTPLPAMWLVDVQSVHCALALRRPANEFSNQRRDSSGKVLQVVLGAGQGGHDATQGGSEWRQSIETNSTVTSDTAHPVAYLVSPTRNVNGDYFFLTNMHRSVPNTRTSYLTVSYALSPNHLSQVPSQSPVERDQSRS